MAASIIGGLVENGADPGRILVADPAAASREKLSADFGVTASADNHDVCARADILVLAVKPQVMKEVASDIAEHIPGGAAVVSIAAGIPVVALQQWLGADRAIVRCMPNTPALVHKGATGLFATANVDDDQKAAVGAIFDAVGTVAWLDSEADIDVVTALSGSGPAYFFLMIETMEKVAVDMGLSPDTARSLCLQTALGAATMAASSDVDCTELRRRVTSPGGTTQQAIATFEDGHFAELVARAMGAARQRAEEMADDFSN